MEKLLNLIEKAVQEMNFDCYGYEENKKMSKAKAHITILQCMVSHLSIQLLNVFVAGAIDHVVFKVDQVIQLLWSNVQIMSHLHYETWNLES